MKLSIAMAIAGLLCSQPVLSDTSISVLGVYPGNSGLSTNAMAQQLQRIQQSWGASGLTSETNGITITLLNYGLAHPIAGLPHYQPNDTSNAVDLAMVNPSVVAARNAFAADVVIVFTDSGNGTACGQTNSATSGVPESESQYLSIVLLTASYCPWDNTAAHEFGHLFGADHFGESGRYPDSRAIRYETYSYDPETEQLIVVGFWASSETR